MDIGQHSYPFGVSLSLLAGNIGSDNTGLVHDPGQFRTGGYRRLLAVQDKGKTPEQEKKQTPEHTIHGFNLLKQRNIFQ
jgi:hypothetical protein